MNNTMKYKGYIGSVAFDAEDRIFHGRVLGVSSALIGFEGATVADLEKDFQNAVDDYLEMCAEQGKEPEKPFKGSFNIRLSPDLHQSLVLNAANQKMTLNAYIKTVLEHVVEKGGTAPILFGMDIDCGCRIRNRIYSLAIAVTEGN